MVPKGGFEPPRVAPHAPQACVSASSTTSALRVALRVSADAVTLRERSL